MPSTNELLQEGRYRIHQRAVGSEDVFEAYDTVRNTNVVVREIPVKLNKVATMSQRESLRLAFTNQAKALTEIDHHSLPHVHDYFSEIDRQYLVMDPVEGESLASMLSRSGRPFTLEQVLNWADQLLDALQYLHTHRPSIIHRNIRPQNVNLDQSGRITLLGVGVEGSGSGGDDASNLRYSPLEQIWTGLDPASQKAITNSYDDRSERILKEPLDARSDIYSLGATLYFLVTGREPVDPLERSIDVLEGKLDPLREPTKVDSAIPAEISDVLMKALEIKRENRYDSALIMRQVLHDAVARVQERLKEEELEQEEAAEIIRRAAQQKMDAAVREEENRDEEQLVREAAEQELRLREAEEQERRQAEAEEIRRRDAEEHARKEREAAEERLRIESEQALRLKEAEDRRRHDEEMRRRADAPHAEPIVETGSTEPHGSEPTAVADSHDVASDDLLEIPVAAEVTAYRDELNDIDEAELAAVLEEIEAAESASDAGSSTVHISSSPALRDVLEHVDVEPTEELTPEPLPEPDFAAANDVDDQIFSIPEKRGFAIPLPAMAGGIGLLVVIAAGVWFTMSGSSVPSPNPGGQPLQVAQPLTEPSPATEPIISTQAQETQEGAPASASADPVSEPPAAEVRNTPAPVKAKKSEPVRQEPEKKKAVTVDDLINDN